MTFSEKQSRHIKSLISSSYRLIRNICLRCNIYFFTFWVTSSFPELLVFPLSVIRDISLHCLSLYFLSPASVVWVLIGIVRTDWEHGRRSLRNNICEVLFLLIFFLHFLQCTAITSTTLSSTLSLPSPFLPPPPLVITFCLENPREFINILKLSQNQRGNSAAASPWVKRSRSVF